MTIQLGATFFIYAFVVYLAATVCYLAFLIKPLPSTGKTGTALLSAGLLLHTVSLVMRTMVTHRAPFISIYEYMVSFSWGAVVVYLVLETWAKNRTFGAFAVPFITAFALVASRLPGDNSPIAPALKSALQVPHIASAILAYGAFAVAFMLAIMFLLAEREAGKAGSFWATRLPAPQVIDQAIYHTIAFGFLMQTLLIILGAIWAQVAWGRYWGWDPKETWALVTWLIYAAYLHTRTALGWRGRRSALVALAGFLATIFTLFGVSYMLTGLHSYLKK